MVTEFPKEHDISTRNRTEKLSCVPSYFCGIGCGVSLLALLGSSMTGVVALVSTDDLQRQDLIADAA